MKIDRSKAKARTVMDGWTILYVAEDGSVRFGGWFDSLELALEECKESKDAVAIPCARPCEEK